MQLSIKIIHSLRNCNSSQQLIEQGTTYIKSVGRRNKLWVGRTDWY
jgi:hypothetical protein